MSTTTDPGRIPAMTPCGPATTCSTSGVSESMVMTIFERAATSAGVPDTTAPRAASSAVFETVRLWTVSGWPPSRMCPAIGRPMIPNPMNPTGVLSGCVMIRPLRLGSP